MPIGLVVPDGEKRFEGIADGQGVEERGREHEVADLLRFLKAMNIHNVAWLTADVHCAAAHYYDPQQAGFKDFNGFWEFVAWPLHAGMFGPNPLDSTFGPKVEFCSVPHGMEPNQSPSKGMQCYGRVSLDARSMKMTVFLHSRDGKRIHQQVLSPVS